MMKKVIVLDGRIINVGEWDYQLIDINGEEVAMNPLPQGAIEEEREMEFTEKHGWREVGYIKPPTESEQRLADLEIMMTELLIGGMI